MASVGAIFGDYRETVFVVAGVFPTVAALVLTFAVAGIFHLLARRSEESALNGKLALAVSPVRHRWGVFAIGCIVLFALTWFVLWMTIVDYMPVGFAILLLFLYLPIGWLLAVPGKFPGVEETYKKSDGDDESSATSSSTTSSSSSTSEVSSSSELSPSSSGSSSDPAETAVTRGKRRPGKKHRASKQARTRQTAHKLVKEMQESSEGEFESDSESESSPSASETSESDSSASDNKTPPPPEVKPFFLQRWVDRKEASILAKISARPVMTLGLLLVWLIAALLLLIFLHGGCFAMEPNEFNSRVSRGLSSDSKFKFCNDADDAKPCHVYLTLPEDKDSSSSIIVNFQTAGPFKNRGADLPDGWNAYIFWDNVSRPGLSSYSNMKEGSVSRQTSLDIDRVLCWVQLSELQPNQTYYFRVGLSKNGGSPDLDDSDTEDDFSSEYHFTTIPASNARIAAGGDVGRRPEAVDLLKGSAPFRANLMVFGGDISYANNFETCYWAWDEFLQNIADAYEAVEKGLLTPMVLATGNHDAGGYQPDSKKIHFLTKWFNQQDESVTPNERRTYHSHHWNNTLLLSADSGHSASVDGEQKDWLVEQLKEANKPGPSYRANRMATYHVPAYPSIRAFDTPLSVIVRENWVPVWDEYKMGLALENHDHAYKRTFLLKDNKQVDTATGGTLYVGDGAWGAKVREVGGGLATDKEKEIKIFEEAAHFIIIDTGATCNKLTAFGLNNKTVDTVEAQCFA